MSKANITKEQEEKKTGRFQTYRRKLGQVPGAGAGKN